MSDHSNRTTAKLDQAPNIMADYLNIAKANIEAYQSMFARHYGEDDKAVIYLAESLNHLKDGLADREQERVNRERYATERGARIIEPCQVFTEAAAPQGVASPADVGTSPTVVRGTFDGKSAEDYILGTAEISLPFEKQQLLRLATYVRVLEEQAGVK